MKKVTRADVARDAGVTPTIVSFVVNNNRYVSQEKRQRVLETTLITLTTLTTGDNGDNFWDLAFRL